MRKVFSLATLCCVLAMILPSGALAQKKAGQTASQNGKTDITGNPGDTSILHIEPFRLEILSPSSGVQFYRYGLVFLSNSKNESGMLRSHTSFGSVEAYYAPFQDSSLGRHTIFSKQAAFDIPCDGMTFTRDFSEMFYSRIGGKTTSEKIYRAGYKSAGSSSRSWVSDPDPLGFCTGNYSYTHPALSANGDTMIFACNRNDSRGGFDLYSTTRDGGSWSVPVNLGDQVNTSRDELYPFIDSGNNLYFSSNGHQGSGGFDIFICRFNGKGWDEPVNLGNEINSPNDEIALTIDRTDGKTAFYTRRIVLGKESQKLFRITLGNHYTANNFRTLPEALEYLAASGPAGEEAKATVTAAAEPGNLLLKEPPREQQPAVTETSRPPEAAPQNKIGQRAKAVSEAADTARVTTMVRVPAENKQVSPPVQQQKSPETKPAAVEKPALKTNAPAGTVVFRVQFSSSRSARGSFEISFGGAPYKTFEYLYNGMYRSCVGEFHSPQQASALQKIVQKEGFPDAFVAAFRDNVRATDPSLFK